MRKYAFKIRWSVVLPLILFFTIHSTVLALPFASTYLGGNNLDGGWPRISMAIDSQGNVFVASTTLSQNFPVTTGAYCENFIGSSMVYVAKFNSDLSELLACTYIGGGNYDFCYGLALDENDNVYITGHTSSGIFPTTLGVYGPEYFGDGGYDIGDDVFISKFDNNLSTLLASTFLGGEDWEMATDIKIAHNGDIFICGFTDGADYPTTENAFDSDLNGNMSVFISRLDANLTTLLASTYLSTRQPDDYPQIALDSQDNVFIAGVTDDSDFPVTEECLSNELNGFLDAYISCLNNDLTSLIASTFLGGSSMDFGYDITLDSEDNLYVVGHTDSPDIPGIENGINNTPGGGPDGFVCRLTHDLTTVEAASYFGGTENDNVMGIEIKDNDVFLSGYTDSNNFGSTPDVFDIDFNGSTDAFIIKCNPDLNTLYASTYFGGSSVEHNNTILSDNNGNVFFCGSTRSNDLPITEYSYDPDYNGSPNALWEGDIYIARLNENLQDELSFVRTENLHNNSFELLNAYPNPFNSFTEIVYQLESQSNIKIVVFNLEGKLVETLLDCSKPGGIYKINWNASNYSSGTYLIKLSTNQYSKSVKTILLK